MDASKQITELRKLNQQRKFVQTIDLSVNFFADKKKLNVTGNLVLPHGKGKAGKVCIFSDSATDQAKALGIDVITRKELMGMNADGAKELVNKYDYFFAESTLMLDIGKRFGPVLAPKGKMPKPFQAGQDLKSAVTSGQKTFPISLKSNTIHLTIGKEDFTDKQIVENVDSVMAFLSKTLPKGPTQIRSAYLKFSMSPSVRLV